MTLSEQDADGLYHIVIDLLGVMLHPAGLGVVLLVVDIGTVNHVALLVKQ